MYPIVFPNYNHSILNVTASILKYYHATPKVPTNKELDQILSKGYRNVVYILVDAMGVDVLKKHHEVAETLSLDLHDSITSVFPSTTVSATTAVLTGLPPIETGWLGWCQYVKEEDKSVIFFMNKDYYSEETKFDYNISEKYCPVEKIYSIIEKASPDVKTREVFPAFKEKNHDTFMKECQTIVNETKEPGKHFIYTYWDKLDTVMHDKGPGSKDTKAMLKTIDDGYKYLTNSLESDSIIIVIADHGQVDVCPIELRRYPDIWETFTHAPSVESRATAFFVKEEAEAKFVTLFNHYFRNYFILMKSKDALAMNLFGYGKMQSKVHEFLGNYFAIAIDHYYFKLAEGPYFMKGQHAGILEEEMIVPLIIHTKS